MVENIFLQHRAFSDALYFIGAGSVAHHNADSDFPYAEGGAGKSGKGVKDGINLLFMVYSLRFMVERPLLKIGVFNLFGSCFLVLAPINDRQ